MPRSEAYALLTVVGVLVVVVMIFIRISLRLRCGGLTTIVLWTTDEFLNTDKRRAAETIVDRNSGKTGETLSQLSGLYGENVR